LIKFLIKEVLPSADKKYTLALKRQIEKTLGDVDHEGKNFYNAAHTFTSDPLNIEKRQAMISASRTLVREVTRLLILADYVDVANIVELVNNAEQLFANVRHSKNKGEFMHAMKDLGAKCGEIYVKTGHRQEDILPEQEDQRYAIAVARQNLKGRKSFIISQ
jgi:catenin alpha